MKKGLLLLCVFLLGAILGIAKCEAESKTSRQPISVGEMLYATIGMGKSNMGLYTQKVWTFCDYKFLGIDNNKIKVEFTEKMASEADPSPRPMNRNILELPLNAKKQALLKVKTLENNDLSATKELLITVADDFGRIRVEEYTGQ